MKSQVHIKLGDYKHEDISQHFEQTYEYIDANLLTTNVFVHCMAGISRSATIVISYLMKKFGWNVEKVVEYVKVRRSRIFPN